MQRKREIRNYWDGFIRENKTSKKMISQKVSDIIVNNAILMFKRNVLDGLDGKQSILEIGCGSGAFTDHIVKQKNVGRLVCTDLSKEGVKLCKKKGFRAMVADAERLPFKDNSFDIVCGFEFLHHLNNPQKAIKEACRVARRVVYFNEPNSWNPVRRVMEKVYYPRAAHETSYSVLQFRKWFAREKFTLKLIPYNFLMPYFSNNALVRTNIFMDSILNALPTKYFGASIAVIAKSKN